MTQPLKLTRTVFAPAPTGPGAVNRIVSVVLEEDQAAALTQEARLTGRAGRERPAGSLVRDTA